MRTVWIIVHSVSLQLFIKENVAKLREGIQKLRDDLKQDRNRLVDSEELLRQLQESKQAANENAKDYLTELEKLREDVQKIAREKSNIEMELKIKERECQLLSELKEKDKFFEEKKTSVTFTIQTSAMEPLSYQWQRKPPGEGDDWQPCDVEGSNKATLTIPTAQESDK